MKKTLPVQAQMSPVYVIIPLDYNADGNEDLILGGNINHARLKFGKYDANYGMLLQGDGSGNFKYISQQRSGVRLTGDVRSAVTLDNTIIFGINEQPIQAYSHQ